MGRHTTYSDKVADIICERLAGGESLKKICEDDTLPSQTTIYKWLADQPNFAVRYAHAREAQADALFDEVLHIANTPLIGEKVKIDADGNEEITRGDMIEHRRLQIDARKWMAGKLRPKKYGDKIELEHDVSDPMKVFLQSVAARGKRLAG